MRRKIDILSIGCDRRGSGDMIVVMWYGLMAAEVFRDDGFAFTKETKEELTGRWIKSVAVYSALLCITPMYAVVLLLLVL